MSAREVAKRFSVAVEASQFSKAFEMLAEDGTYTVIGTTDASRTYNGRKDVFDNLIPLLSTFRAAPVLRFQQPIVDGDRAVLLASGKGVGPFGPYDQPYYAFVTRVRGDEFAEIVEFMDTSMLESAVFGRKLVAATA